MRSESRKAYRYEPEFENCWTSCCTFIVLLSTGSFYIFVFYRVLQEHIPDFFRFSDQLYLREWLLFSGVYMVFVGICLIATSFDICCQSGAMEAISLFNMICGGGCVTVYFYRPVDLIDDVLLYFQDYNKWNLLCFLNIVLNCFSFRIFKQSQTRFTTCMAIICFIDTTLICMQTHFLLCKILDNMSGKLIAGNGTLILNAYEKWTLLAFSIIFLQYLLEVARLAKYDLRYPDLTHSSNDQLTVLPCASNDIIFIVNLCLVGYFVICFYSLLFRVYNQLFMLLFCAYLFVILSVKWSLLSLKCFNYLRCLLSRVYNQFVLLYHALLSVIVAFKRRLKEYFSYMLSLPYQNCQSSDAFNTWLLIKEKNSHETLYTAENVSEGCSSNTTAIHLGGNNESHNILQLVITSSTETVNDVNSNATTANLFRGDDESFNCNSIHS